MIQRRTRSRRGKGEYSDHDLSPTQRAQAEFVPFTRKEIKHLFEGVGRYSVCQMDKILQKYEFHPTRTKQDLVNKYHERKEFPPFSYHHTKDDLCPERLYVNRVPENKKFSDREMKYIYKGVNRFGKNFTKILQFYRTKFYNRKPKDIEREYLLDEQKRLDDKGYIAERHRKYAHERAVKLLEYRKKSELSRIRPLKKRLLSIPSLDQSKMEKIPKAIVKDEDANVKMEDDSPKEFVHYKRNRRNEDKNQYVVLTDYEKYKKEIIDDPSFMYHSSDLSDTSSQAEERLTKNEVKSLSRKRTSDANENHQQNLLAKSLRLLKLGANASVSEIEASYFKYQQHIKSAVEREQLNMALKIVSSYVNEDTQFLELPFVLHNKYKEVAHRQDFLEASKKARERDERNAARRAKSEKRRKNKEANQEELELRRYTKGEVKMIFRGVNAFGRSWTKILDNYSFKENRVAASLGTKYDHTEPPATLLSESDDDLIYEPSVHSLRATRGDDAADAAIAEKHPPPGMATQKKKKTKKTQKKKSKPKAKKRTHNQQQIEEIKAVQELQANLVVEQSTTVSGGADEPYVERVARLPDTRKKLNPDTYVKFSFGDTHINIIQAYEKKEVSHFAMEVDVSAVDEIFGEGPRKESGDYVFFGRLYEEVDSDDDQPETVSTEWPFMNDDNERFKILFEFTLNIPKGYHLYKMEDDKFNIYQGSATVIWKKQ